MKERLADFKENRTDKAAWLLRGLPVPDRIET